MNQRRIDRFQIPHDDTDATHCEKGTTDLSLVSTRTSAVTGYMLCVPMSVQKMTYDAATGTAIYLPLGDAHRLEAQLPGDERSGWSFFAEPRIQVDPAGYQGQLCIDSVRCTAGGPATFVVMPGTHSVSLSARSAGSGWLIHRSSSTPMVLDWWRTAWGVGRKLAAGRVR